MDKWEYYVISLAKEAQVVSGYLDELGRDGWELVAVENGVYFFKRPKVTYTKESQEERKDKE
jgi:hypothetical protein